MSLSRHAYRATALILGGYTEQQAAAELGTSQATVSRRLSDACRSMPALDVALALAKRFHQRNGGRR